MDIEVQGTGGAVERFLGIGFKQAAVTACVRAERAIAEAEERIDWGGTPSMIPVIDDLYALVTELSDELGDLEASADIPDVRDQDGRRAGRARTTYHRVLATTGVLLAMARGQ
jgi:hypothetical protein